MDEYKSFFESQDEETDLNNFEDSANVAEEVADFYAQYDSFFDDDEKSTADPTPSSEKIDPKKLEKERKRLEKERKKQEKIRKKSQKYYFDPESHEESYEYQEPVSQQFDSQYAQSDVQSNYQNNAQYTAQNNYQSNVQYDPLLDPKYAGLSYEEIQILEEKRRIQEENDRVLERQKAFEEEFKRIAENQRLIEEEKRLAEEIRLAEERRIQEEKEIEAEYRRREEERLIREAKLSQEILQKQEEDISFYEQRRAEEERRILEENRREQEFLESERQRLIRLAEEQRTTEQLLREKEQKIKYEQEKAAEIAADRAFVAYQEKGEFAVSKIGFKITMPPREPQNEDEDLAVSRFGFRPVAQEALPPEEIHADANEDSLNQDSLSEDPLNIESNIEEAVSESGYQSAIEEPKEVASDLVAEESGGLQRAIPVQINPYEYIKPEPKFQEEEEIEVEPEPPKPVEKTAAAKRREALKNRENRPFDPQALVESGFVQITQDKLGTFRLRFTDYKHEFIALSSAFASKALAKVAINRVFGAIRNSLLGVSMSLPPKFEIYQDEFKKYIFKLVDSNFKVLIASRVFVSRKTCAETIRVLKNIVENHTFLP